MSLTISGYMRQFYKGNSFGATATGRSGQSKGDLLSADMKAIRRAVDHLEDYDYEEGEGGELMNKVQAFVNTYNNYIDSAKNMDNTDVNRYLSKMKKLTKEYAGELEDIGISIKSSGKLEIDKKAMQDTGRYQVGLLFSEDAEFSKMSDKYVKNMSRMFIRNNLNVQKQSPQKQPSDSTPPAAGSTALSARQTVNAFVGNHIDYML